MCFDIRARNTAHFGVGPTLHRHKIANVHVVNHIVVHMLHCVDDAFRFDTVITTFLKGDPVTILQTSSAPTGRW
jgi:hypothetical protein